MRVVLVHTTMFCDTVVTIQSRHSRDTVATRSRHSRDMVFLAFPAREHKRSTSPENCLIPRARFAKKTMSRLCRDCVATVSRLCRDCMAPTQGNFEPCFPGQGIHRTCPHTPNAKSELFIFRHWTMPQCRKIKTFGFQGCTFRCRARALYDTPKCCHLDFFNVDDLKCVV